MSDAGAPASQINLANRQIVLADRMSRRVTEILAGGDRAVTAADALSRDSRGVRPGAGRPEGRQRRNRRGPRHHHRRRSTRSTRSTSCTPIRSRKWTRSCRPPPTCSRCSRPRPRSPDDSNVLLENAQALFGTFGSSLDRVFPNNMWADRFRRARAGRDHRPATAVHPPSRLPRRSSAPRNSTSATRKPFCGCSTKWVRSQKAT